MHDIIIRLNPTTRLIVQWSILRYAWEYMLNFMNFFFIVMQKSITRTKSSWIVLSSMAKAQSFLRCGFILCAINGRIYDIRYSSWRPSLTWTLHRFYVNFPSLNISWVGSGDWILVSSNLIVSDMLGLQYLIFW
jgi:hypothetical protein